jgi:uncharacterized membrane protein
MTTMQRDPLVEDYLRRLDAAAAHLPADRRAELAQEIREHIREAGAEGEAAVREVLDRLGSPEEIAAAEAAPPTRGRLETAALIVLAVGFLVPVVGYLIGAALVLASRAWTARDKLLGLLISPSVFVLGGVVTLAASASVAEGESFDSGLGPLEIAVLFAVFFSGLLSAAFLAWRLRTE